MLLERVGGRKKGERGSRGRGRVYEMSVSRFGGVQRSSVRHSLVKWDCVVEAGSLPSNSTAKFLRWGKHQVIGIEAARWRGVCGHGGHWPGNAGDPRTYTSHWKGSSVPAMGTTSTPVPPSCPVWTSAGWGGVVWQETEWRLRYRVYRPVRRGWSLATRRRHLVVTCWRTQRWWGSCMGAQAQIVRANILKLASKDVPVSCMPRHSCS